MNINLYKFIHKNVGETPLEALERFRVEKIEEAKSCAGVGTCDESKGEVNYWQNVPMTYAGRLDPMAEGQLLILIGNECKNKEKYLGLDKEYEVEVLFGIETDTYDILGIPKLTLKTDSNIDIDFQRYVGKFVQEYPPYSSKTFNGKQLHELARANELPIENMPKNKVEIYSIDSIETYCIEPDKLLNDVKRKISLVKGDFRQQEISIEWENMVSRLQQKLQIVRIVVKCSSGTYMRSLANRIGEDVGVGACALSINRTKIFGIEGNN